MQEVCYQSDCLCVVSAPASPEDTSPCCDMFLSASPVGRQSPGVSYSPRPLPSLPRSPSASSLSLYRKKGPQSGSIDSSVKTQSWAFLDRPVFWAILGRHDRIRCGLAVGHRRWDPGSSPRQTAFKRHFVHPPLPLILNGIWLWNTEVT